MTDEHIYLSIVRNGDAFDVVDQDGRKVAYVRSVTFSAKYNDAAEFAVTCLDAAKLTHKPHTGLS